LTVIQQILETSIKRKDLEFMSSLSDAVAASGFASRVIHDSQLADLLGGSDARRYGLVNRVLADRSLIRLRRGAYVLAKAMRSGDLHPFSIAQGLVPGSYVSFESALSWHGWIPEAVFMTSSVVPTRKTIEIPTGHSGSNRRQGEHVQLVRKERPEAREHHVWAHVSHPAIFVVLAAPSCSFTPVCCSCLSSSACQTLRPAKTSRMTASTITTTINPARARRRELGFSRSSLNARCSWRAGLPDSLPA
jgi:hypothetical protein